MRHGISRGFFIKKRSSQNISRSPEVSGSQIFPQSCADFLHPAALCISPFLANCQLPFANFFCQLPTKFRGMPGCLFRFNIDHHFSSCMSLFQKVHHLHCIEKSVASVNITKDQLFRMNFPAANDYFHYYFGSLIFLINK